MEYLRAFIVGGIICCIGQIFIDRTRLTPARILVGFVVAGVILSALGFYEPLVEFAGAGSHTDTDPESILNAIELEKGIKNLDEEFRKAFDMYNEGYKYKEIADCLHLTIGTVKSRIFYSRKKLMNQMNEYYPN